MIGKLRGYLADPDLLNWNVVSTTGLRFKAELPELRGRLARELAELQDEFKTDAQELRIVLRGTRKTNAADPKVWLVETLLSIGHRYSARRRVVKMARWLCSCSSRSSRYSAKPLRRRQRCGPSLGESGRSGVPGKTTRADHGQHVRKLIQTDHRVRPSRRVHLAACWRDEALPAARRLSSVSP